MQTESTDALRRDLELVGRQFERWRRGRRLGKRIPAVLWRAAVVQARRHGVSKTSQALRLDYYALQRRLGDREPEHQDRQGFVEVSLPSSLPGPHCRLEVCEPGGKQIRVDLCGLSAADLTTLLSRVCDSAP